MQHWGGGGRERELTISFITFNYFQNNYFQGYNPNFESVAYVFNF